MFFGRTSEIAQLAELTLKTSASLAVITGRRRIGKSSLVDEFGGKFPKYYVFQGLAPSIPRNKHEQLKNFAAQFSEQFSLPTVSFSDWNDAFSHLAEQAARGKVLIFFDEISWMGEGDNDFTGKLKIAWDTKFKRNPKLILVLCGSVSSWIQQNILQNTDFVGRISLVLRLDELDLRSSAQFWEARASRVSNFEKLRLLSVTGCIPKYLEEINPAHSSDENLRRLCFSPGGYLLEDFDRIFSDIFGRRSEIYRSIARALISRRLSLQELAEELDMQVNGDLSNYLRDLELSGFIEREWAYKADGDRSRMSQYRIRDCYLRFYLKFIEPHRDRIRKGIFKFQGLEQLSQWRTIAGLQFENLVLSRIPAILEPLGISHETILAASPHFQRKTNRSEPCQVDLLITCKNNTIYLCEMKFRELIKSSVIQEVEEKRRKLKVPKYTSIRPVLIYAGELEEKLIDQDYFDKTLNFETLLN